MPGLVIAQLALRDDEVLADGVALRAVIAGQAFQGVQDCSLTRSSWPACHLLENGMLFNVKGFTKAGDIIVDKNWVIGREFGEIAHGFAVTSFASQGKSVDRVWLAQSSLSFPASSKQQFYVSASRAKWNLTIYTDSKAELREAIRRSDPRMSALDLVKPAQREMQPAWKRHLAFMRRLATMVALRRSERSVPEPVLERKEIAHER